MLRVTTHEAKSNLSRLIAQVLEGHDVIICRGDQPTVRLVPILPSEVPKPRRPPVGTITSGAIHYAEDTFAPLTDDELAQWGL